MDNQAIARQSPRDEGRADHLVMQEDQRVAESGEPSLDSLKLSNYKRFDGKF